MSAQPQPAFAEQVLNIRKAPSGHGQQYEIKWQGQSATTWEAASRVRKQIPALVQAFEQQQQPQVQPQQQQQSQQEGVVGDVHDDAPVHQSAPSDDSELRAQMAALMQIVQEQSKQLQQLRASPQLSAQASPVLPSPQAPQRALPPQQLGAQAAASVAASQPTSRFARKEPRAQDLHEYDGAAGPKLDAWLDELGAAIDLFQLNGREAVDFGVSRLRGAARQWWNTLGAQGKAAVNDAAALSKALRARFQPITTERVAREQLRALRQGSRGVNDYISDFQRLHALLPDMSGADALFAFESGLSASLAEKLRVQGVGTLQEAITMAARVGGLMAAQPPTASQGRSAQFAANQMDVGDGDAADAMENRIARSVLNALQSQSAGSSGLGAKTQTQRSYEDDRKGGSFRGRGGVKGGRGGRFGGRGGGVMTYTIPGVPPALVDQRRAAGQCLRCGSGEHRGMECPNAPSALQPSN